MKVLAGINKLAYVDSIILGPHYERRENQDLLPLPKSDFLEQVSVGIGRIDHFENAELPEIVRKVTGDVARCLQDQSRESALNLNFSIVPDMDDDLLPKDLEKICEFFNILIDELADAAYPVPIKHLIFGLSHNDVSREAMEMLGKDFAKLQKIQGYIRDVAHRLALARGKVLTSKTNTEEYTHSGLVCYRNFTEIVVEKFCQITVGQRLVEENKGKAGRALRELDLRTRPDFNIALFSDYAWHYHSKDMVGDRSLTMSYDELEAIMAKCADDTTNLRREVNNSIVEKRRLKVVNE
ncbi:hypothetical protein IT411_01765 [Candidatus Peregrinibacteria bacterium]|nr:hypothetical protein [Candidatus Peregrinibacteria bacterium]